MILDNIELTKLVNHEERLEATEGVAAGAFLLAIGSLALNFIMADKIQKVERRISDVERFDK